MAKKVIKSSAIGVTASAANTTYILKAESEITNLGATGIDASLSAKKRSFVIEGTITDVERGIVIGESGAPSAANAVSVAKSGAIYAETLAVHLVGDNHSLDNSGVVASMGAGTYVMHIEGDGFNLVNRGTLSGENGIFIQGGDFSIVNKGIIWGCIDALPGADESGKLVNSGEIVGVGDAYRGRFGKETVINSGTVIGDIFLDDGADRFINKGGYVIGEIRGGLGDDRYTIDDAQLTITEIDGAGNDEVRTSVTFDLPDYVEVGRLMGKTSIDIAGNASDNTLFGNNGKNHLSGGDGVDNLIGGKGNDTLDGGAMGDRFLFSNGMGRDTITSFDDAADVLLFSKYKGLDDFADLKVRQSGADTVITLRGGDRITIENFDADNITEADVNFI